VHIQELGHAVVKVRDRARSEAFYSEVLGIPIVARSEKMTFFTLGNHHDFAIYTVSPDAPDAIEDAPGLYHVAFRVGTTLDELRAVKEELAAAGVTPYDAMDHTVGLSLYIHDPDGNSLELYVDTNDIWKREPETVADDAPLDI
jgi:catechol-2,3-dioxygenase